ncbi:MAG: class I SAM-dependent RNA methyltransferase [Sandaracinaceae bacterium]|nr:class I SAM-dependent RNA methyltransferase [Sandaracinaceae bacterium]
MSNEIEGTVRDFSRFGEGVVATSQGVVFVPGVLPGERVSLMDIRPRGKGVLYTDKVRVLDPSTQRQDPPCPIVGRCGGCPMMIASPKLELRFKRDQLEQALRGLPNVEAVQRGWVAPVKTLGYRRRARMAWTAGRGRPRIGYRRPRSTEVTDVRVCAVLDDALDRAFAKARAVLGPHLAGEGQLHLAMGEGGGVVMALRSDAMQPPELYGALEALVTEGVLVGAALKAGGASVDATWGSPREVRDGYDGKPLVGTVAGFSQAHDEVNRALVARVLELAAPAERDVLELFCGSGNITIALAATAKSVVGIEQDEAAAEACRENLKARGLVGTIRTADAEAWRSPTVPDVVVLDPPRTGAAGAIKRIEKLGPKEVVYVSCDPPTLRRDLESLCAAGWVPTDAVALDMFPQTAHMECVVRLERK